MHKTPNQAHLEAFAIRSNKKRSKHIKNIYPQLSPGLSSSKLFGRVCHSVMSLVCVWHAECRSIIFTSILLILLENDSQLKRRPPQSQARRPGTQLPHAPNRRLQKCLPRTDLQAIRRETCSQPCGDLHLHRKTHPREGVPLHER